MGYVILDLLKDDKPFFSSSKRNQNDIKPQNVDEPLNKPGKSKEERLEEIKKYLKPK